MGFSAAIQMIRRNKTKIKEYNTIVTAKYIYINIMRGKKDVTTFPDKPVS